MGSPSNNSIENTHSWKKHRSSDLIEKIEANWKAKKVAISKNLIEKSEISRGSCKILPVRWTREFSTNPQSGHREFEEPLPRTG